MNNLIQSLLSKVSLEKLIYFILIVFLLFYILYRAEYLSFTHDESISYLVIKEFTFGVDSISYNDAQLEGRIRSNYLTYLISTNTHILNSGLMKLSMMVFGENEFFLRLPNILSFLFFVMFIYKITELSEHRITRISAFCILIFNPYLLEFFSLARGYGLAIMFMTGSLYFIIITFNKSYIDGGKNRLLLAFVFAMLAALSNFIFINYVLIVFLLCLKGISKKYFGDQNILLFLRYKYKLFFITFLGGVILTIPIIILVYFDQFYYGEGKTWKEAGYSFVSRLVYAKSMNEVSFYDFIACLFLFLVPLIILLRNAKTKEKTAYLPLIIMIISFCIVIIQLLFFGIPIPYERSGIYFLILLPLSFTTVFLLNKVSSIEWKVYRFAFIYIAVYSIYNFLTGFNCKDTYDWAYDSDTKSAYLSAMQSNDDSAPLTLSCNWYYVPTFNYYRISKEANEMVKVLYDEIDEWSDFIYLNSNDTISLPNESYVVVEVFENSGGVLYRKK